MKIKKEYVILLAVIMALSLYLVLRNTDRTRYELPEIPPIAGNAISKIEISNAGTSVVLNKKDSKWYIAPQGYPADAGKVIEMLDTIGDLAVTAMVSESKDYSRYDLDDDRKITVKAWTGNTLKREFEVGKTALSYRHTFVKLADDGRVYHARGNFRDKFDQTVESIRDKTVLSFDQDDIQVIHISRGGEVAEFTRVPAKAGAGKGPDAGIAPPSTKAETLWRTADGREGDKSKLDGLLVTLSNLRCERYIDDRKKEDFTSPVWSIKFKGAEECTLSIFAKTGKDDKCYPAVSSGSDYPFLLPDWQADNVMKGPQEMLKESDKP
jgi:hypothetical protein